MHITELPTDIIEEILVQCDPIEVANVAQTCSALRSLIYDSQDSKIWRELYLATKRLDDLRKCVSQHGHPAHVEWKRNLQRIVRARKIVADLSLLKPGELEEVLQTLLMLILYHRPRPSTADRGEVTSRNISSLSAALDDFIDRLEEMTSLTFAERQLLSRLHCYYGYTEKDMRDDQARVKSRVYVYTMRNYKPENDYGPLFSNGAVNWEHMLALYFVVYMNMVDAEIEFPEVPMCLPQMQVVIPVGADSAAEEGKKNQDWVGLEPEGGWVFSFCSCSREDLLEFNEQTTVDTSMFEDPEFLEDLESLDVNLCLERVEPDPAHPTTPILHFFGKPRM